jgi:signal transduction histidine kinase
MDRSVLTIVFFLYGLAFFSMGLIITQEVGHCSDKRLRQSLWYLAAFGILHGLHEWYEMFEVIGIFGSLSPNFLEAMRISLLVLSFLALGTFGSMLMTNSDMSRRLMLLVPLTLAAVWSFGTLTFLGRYPLGESLWTTLDVWARYTLAVPSSLLACTGLLIQQREFRRVGLARFGRDSLWAAVAFAWYGLVGQIFTRPSSLWPSMELNDVLFAEVFGFPIQILRAGASVLAAVFVIRFLRSFEVEIKKKLQDLQAAQLSEAQHRELVFGELLHRVVEAQEAERQRVARELHDETGQALTALGMGLRGASTILRADPEKAALNLRQLEGLVGSSLNELQRLIADLRPSHLDDLGLPAALRWYCGNLQSRMDIHVTFQQTGPVRELPAEVRIVLFRVAQEALTNVIKHSGSKTASVRLHYLRDEIILEVEDRGCGFDIQTGRSGKRPAWGLLGMEERATLLGGHITILSDPGMGTLVAVSIPSPCPEVDPVLPESEKEVAYDHPSGPG